jgi:hypothetical protein
MRHRNMRAGGATPEKNFKFQNHKTISAPYLLGCDTCDISAGNVPLWPVTAELSELVQ